MGGLIMSNRYTRRLNSYFKLSENNTTVRTEVLAGLTTFITKIGLRETIIRAIPESVINAVTPGVGLFITIIVSLIFIARYAFMTLG